MLQSGPTGPRANRSSGRTNSSRTPSRGGIQKQKTTTPQVDRDGDLIMGAAPATRGANNNGRGARHPRRGPGDFHNPRGPTPNMKNGIDPTKMLQQVLAQSLGSHGTSKGTRNSFKSGRKGGHTHDTKEALDEISVMGLKDSMAAKNPGGGSSELIAWLEQKASKGAPESEIVKIKKVCLKLHAAR